MVVGDIFLNIFVYKLENFSTNQGLMGPVQPFCSLKSWVYVMNMTFSGCIILYHMAQLFNNSAAVRKLANIVVFSKHSLVHVSLSILLISKLFLLSKDKVTFCLRRQTSSQISCQFCQNMCVFFNTLVSYSAHCLHLWKQHETFILSLFHQFVCFYLSASS